MVAGRGRVGHPSRKVVTGPLAGYADGWREELAGRGYAVGSISGQMGLMAHLSCWLSSQGLPAGAVTVEVVEEYLVVRRGQGHRSLVTGPAVAPLLGYLRGLHVVPEPAPLVARGPVEVLLEEFRVYLVEERGLAPESVRSYLHYAEMFLAGLPVPLGAALAGLSAGQVTAFVLRRSGQYSSWYAKAMVTALRSLLRFLHVAGHVRSPLASAVPSVPGWKLTSLPRPVNAGQVAAVLGSCDRDTAGGRRDYAILMLLTRLGLRAGEVSRIELDDIGWRAGEVVVRGKGSQVEVLPLPVDVGQALADYVQHGRPRCASGRLFVILHAPFTGLGSKGSVFAVVQRACRRAGIVAFGPHRLRHAVACDLLRRGASLIEIGQLLRQHDARTTAVYAKVDQDALGALARPCPGGGAA